MKPFSLSTFLLGLAAFSRGALGQTSEYSAIPNTQPWLDTDGKPIDAHGPGFLNVNGTWYWTGQGFETTPPGLPPNPALMNLYRSDDLLNWENVGPIIDVYTPDVFGNQPFANSFPGRPKLLYNKKTMKYVLWIHWEINDSFAPSEVIVATADHVTGPYTVTSKGHRRPGAGNNGTSAMGDRYGAMVLDRNAPAKAENDSSYAYSPAVFSYPPKILQYEDPDPANPNQIKYLSRDDGYGTSQTDNSWTFIFDSFQFNMTLKAIASQMTPYDASAYNEYKDEYEVDPARSIIRFPTSQSNVASAVFEFGDPGDWRKELVPPVIAPTLNESESEEVVWVNGGDAAFITVDTQGADIYYTTDGSVPSLDIDGTSTDKYWDGIRLIFNGTAGTQLTVKTMAVSKNETSSVVSMTYEVAEDPSLVPIFQPIINRPSGVYQAGETIFGWQELRIYSPSYNTECYYTMDGIDPRPLKEGENLGYGSRDFTVWVDPKTEEAFLITASDNTIGRLWKLTDDYTDVVPDKEYDVWVNEARESPALIRNGGADGEWVYMVTSGQSGWYPNQNQYARTRDLSTGFQFARDETGYRDGSSVWSPLQPIGDPTTYKSQSSYILDIGTDQNSSYIYVGDSHDTIEGNLALSTYVFIPISLDDSGPSQTGNYSAGGMTVEYHPNLEVDVAAYRVIEPEYKLLSLNKPVKGSSPKVLTPQQKRAGTYKYDATAANDGINYDVDPYDSIEQFFQPTSTPFYWRVDLEETHQLAWIGLSFRSVSGSDAATHYLVYGSTDDENWDLLADNSANSLPGFMNHPLEGKCRYVRVDVLSVFDVVHGGGADWQIGVYEISVYGF